MTALAFFNPIPAGSSGVSLGQTRIGSTCFALNPESSGTRKRSKRDWGSNITILGRYNSDKSILFKLQSEFGDLTGKLGNGVLTDRLDQVVADLKTIARLCELSLGIGRSNLLADH